MTGRTKYENATTLRQQENNTHLLKQNTQPLL